MTTGTSRRRKAGDSLYELLQAGAITKYDLILVNFIDRKGERKYVFGKYKTHTYSHITIHLFGHGVDGEDLQVYINNTTSFTLYKQQAFMREAR